MNHPQNEALTAFDLTSRSVRVAAVQMVSTPRVEENLGVAGMLVAEAVAQGAELVALPEYFPIMGMSEGDKVRVREDYGCGPIQDFLSASARRHGLWLAAAAPCGSGKSL